MDIRLALNELGITENVGPDLTDYQSMVDGWRIDEPIPTEQQLLDAYDAFLLSQIIAEKTAQLKAEMYRIIAEGFTWQAANPDPWFAVGVDSSMQGFLTRTLLKMNEGRVDPHGGFIRSNGVSTVIDDAGMRELCLFASMWGDAISAIRIQEEEAVVDWGTFNPYAVNWSVTWTGDDAANGWTDNTLTQAP